MAEMKIYKISPGYFLNLNKEVSIFFNGWDIPKPDSTEGEEWEEHIVLTNDRKTVAIFSGRKMKEFEKAINLIESDNRK